MFSDFAVPTAGLNGNIHDTIAGPNGGTISVDGTMDNGVGTLTFVMNNYRSVDFSMNGRITQRTVRTGEGSLPESISLQFSRLRLTDQTGPSLTDLTIDGTLNRELKDTWPDGFRRLTLNLVMLDEDSGDSAWLRDFVIDRRFESPPRDFRAAETYQGRIYDSSNGYVTLSSEGGLLFRSLLDDESPYSGGLLKATGGSGSTWLKPLGRLYAAVLLDADGDGTSDRAMRVPWAAMDEDAPDVPAGRVPMATAISFPQAKRYVPIEPSALLSADADGDWLSFEWQLAVAPAGSSAVLERANSPIPTLTPDQLGDYLLTVRVSDGVHASHDSALITASDVPNAPATGMPVAVLEQPRQLAVNETIEFDASGSYATLFDNEMEYDWTVYAPGESVYRLGTSLDGRMSFTPPHAGLFGVVVRTCFRGNTNCSATERFLAAGVEARYHMPARVGLDAAVKDPLVADFDGDGQAEIGLKSGSLNQSPPSEPDAIALVFRRGVASFDVQAIPMPATGAAAAGDFNGDGIADLVTIADQGLHLGRSDVGGGFTVETVPLAPCPVMATHRVDIVAVTDANGDGRRDIVHVDSCAGTVVTRLQAVDGQLGPPTTRAQAGLGYPYVAIGDVTGDGRADIVRSASATNGGTAGTVTVWAGQPDGTFVQGQTMQTATSPDAAYVVVGDVSGDGREDVVAMTGSRLWIAPQLASGLLDAPTPIVLRSSSIDAPLIGDYDGDGDNDVLVRANGIFLQGPGGLATVPFLPSGPDLIASIGSDTQPVDFNRDGLMDLVSGSPDGYGLSRANGPVVVLGRPADE